LDVTSNDFLGEAYSLQSRLRGRCVIDTWDDFEHPRKVSFVRALGNALLELQSVTKPCTGFVYPEICLPDSRNTIPENF
jgi:hypothetical protein